MKILLIGEYSGLHNTLKKGLEDNGHEVLLVGTGDGFKNYPVDLDYSATFFSMPIWRPIVKLIHKISKFSLIEKEHAYRFKKLLPQLKDFDVVQLINENSIKAHPNEEMKLLKVLFAQNKKVFLLSCGIDYSSVKFALEGNYKYSMLTPLTEDQTLADNYNFTTQYVSPAYKRLHDYLFQNIEGVIASDIDYHLPLVDKAKYLGLIPNPINLDALEYNPLNISEKVIIFHGVNSKNYIKKGQQFFKEALIEIGKKYPNKVDIITTEDLPYSSYINAYNSCHILLDQVYAYDQGYNALEAMAKGKVVFTGAEQEWLDHYGLKENEVAINALPDVNYLVSQLEWLILNPEKLLEISKNAHNFVKKEHDHRKSAMRYLDYWQNRASH